VHGYLSAVSVASCEVEVSATDRSLVQMSPTECGVPECDLEISTTRNLGQMGGCHSRGEK
jgi:hypothetical protein